MLAEEGPKEEEEEEEELENYEVEEEEEETFKAYMATRLLNHYSPGSLSVKFA